MPVMSCHVMLRESDRPLLHLHPRIKALHVRTVRANVHRYKEQPWMGSITTLQSLDRGFSLHSTLLK